MTACEGCMGDRRWPQTQVSCRTPYPQKGAPGLRAGTLSCRVADEQAGHQRAGVLRYVVCDRCGGTGPGPSIQDCPCFKAKHVLTQG